MQSIESRIAVHLGRLFASNGILSSSQFVEALPSQYSPNDIESCLNSLLECKLVRQKDYQGLTLYWTIESEPWNSATIRAVEDIRTLLLSLKSPYLASSENSQKILQKIDDEIRNVDLQIEQIEANELTSSDLPSIQNNQSMTAIKYSAEELLVIKKLKAEIVVIETECSKWAHYAKQCLGILASSYQCKIDELISRMKVTPSVRAFLGRC